MPPRDPLVAKSKGVPVARARLVFHCCPLNDPLVAKIAGLAGREFWRTEFMADRKRQERRQGTEKGGKGDSWMLAI